MLSYEIGANGNYLRRKRMKRVLSGIALTSLLSIGAAQAQEKKGPPPPRLVLSVTSDAWPGRGENKSPAFEFHWTLGTNPAEAPPALQSYAVIFHDVENSTNKTTVDTLHWSAFNIPGTAKGLPEGLGPGDRPDGTRNGPGIASRGGTRPGAYFGPGAGPGPIHHYLFEFYALDTKLDLPANTTRDDLLKAMDGHVIGKAAWYGRFHAPAQ
jgi:Raf kinase inhibitor-like YbhB/YbcL family protein